jgi:ribosomal protein S18 acetylase RimI-like enzyme
MMPPMSRPFALRAAVPEDAEALVAANAEMAAETEGLELDRDRLALGVQALLGDPARGTYLVAEAEGRIVGQLMVTREWSDWRNAWFWWIQSVHVDRGWRRRGVYRALHQECARRAREAGACGLRLYVDQSNGDAQATYAALGMVRSHYDLFETEL